MPCPVPWRVRMTRVGLGNAALGARGGIMRTEGLLAGRGRAPVTGATCRRLSRTWRMRPGRLCVFCLSLSVVLSGVGCGDDESIHPRGNWIVPADMYGWWWHADVPDSIPVFYFAYYPSSARQDSGAYYVWSESNGCQIRGSWEYWASTEELILIWETRDNAPSPQLREWVREPGCSGFALKVSGFSDAPKTVCYERTPTVPTDCP